MISNNLSFKFIFYYELRVKSVRNFQLVFLFVLNSSNVYRLLELFSYISFFFFFRYPWISLRVNENYFIVLRMILRNIVNFLGFILICTYSNSKRKKKNEKLKSNSIIHRFADIFIWIYWCISYCFSSNDNLILSIAFAVIRIIGNRKIGGIQLRNFHEISIWQVQIRKFCTRGITFDIFFRFLFKISESSK